ncbi:hypothetical protein [Botrimarina sp.]|uniref:hypothetical protein n=1 Tax=Botrimarina sp. TaxID=2795802 RepID=UPI0032EE62D3
MSVHSGVGVPEVVISFAGLAVLGVLALAVLFAVVAALKHRRWGWLTGMTVMALSAAVALAAAFVSVIPSTRTVSVPGVETPVSAVPGVDPEAIAAAPRIALDGGAEAEQTRQDPTEAAPEASIGELNTSDAQADASQAAVAATDVAQKSPADELVIGEPAKARPAWIDQPPAANQKVIVVGPFTTRTACQEKATESAVAWVNSQVGAAWPPRLGPMPPLPIDLVEQVTKARHVEARDTSVGEVYFQYALVELDEELRTDLLGRVERERSALTQQRGVRVVTLGGASLLAAVGVLHMALRIGPRRAPTPTA